MIHFVAVWSDIAYNKPVVQSTTVDDAVVSRPVDGIVSTHLDNCTLVGPAEDPWWSVDLGTLYHVSEVAITTVDEQSGSILI